MNNSDIDLIRKKYNSLILEKKRVQNVRDRILELESDPKVKEYLGLVGIVGNMSEEQVEKYAFKSIDKVVCYTKDSNKLLYDYGTVNVISKDNVSDITLNGENAVSALNIFQEAANQYLDNNYSVGQDWVGGTSSETSKLPDPDGVYHVWAHAKYVLSTEPSSWVANYKLQTKLTGDSAKGNSSCETSTDTGNGYCKGGSNIKTGCNVIGKGNCTYCGGSWTYYNDPCNVEEPKTVNCTHGTGSNGKTYASSRDDTPYTGDKKTETACF